MNKKQFAVLFILALLTTTLTGCFNKEPDTEVVDLEARLEKIEAEKEADELEASEQQEDSLEAEQEAKKEELENSSAADKVRLEKELAELKAELNKVSTPIVVTPAPAPAPVSTSSKYGPGMMNHMNGHWDGYLSVCTKSANGKLTLRGGASKTSTNITTIPNGTYGIYYFDRVKVGDYVWYKVDYDGKIGFLRGDFLCY